MPRLLSCPTEPMRSADCCQPPYTPLTSDCVLACLVAKQMSFVGDAQHAWAGKIMFGTTTACKEQWMIQDLQELVTYLHNLFKVRQRSYASTGVIPAMTTQAYLDAKLDCIRDYFQCRYGIDVAGMFYDIGYYDPLHPPSDETISGMPILNEIPCGETPVVQPPPPAFCVIPTVMQVYSFADADQEASSIAGFAYGVISNTNNVVNGWSSHVGEIVIGNTYITLNEDDVVRSIAGEYYVYTGGQLVDMFPPVTVLMNGTTATLEQNGYQDGRDILVRLTDGTTWETAYQGPEANLPADVQTALTGQISTYTTYYVDGCAYGPYPFGENAVACTPQQTVLAVADVIEILSNVYPNVAGDRYLIAFDTFLTADPMFGQVLTFDGNGGYTLTPVLPGEIILAQYEMYYYGNPTWFIGTNSGVAYYYPPVRITVDVTNLTVTDMFVPGGHDITARDVIIEVFIGGSWVEAYNGPDSGLIGGYSTSIPVGATNARISYGGDCPGQGLVWFSSVAYPPVSLQTNAFSPNIFFTPSYDNVNFFEATKWTFGFWIKGTIASSPLPPYFQWGGYAGGTGATDALGDTFSLFPGWLIRRIGFLGEQLCIGQMIWRYSTGLVPEPVPIVEASTWWPLFMPNGDPAHTAINGGWSQIEVVKDGIGPSVEAQDFQVYLNGQRLTLGDKIRVGVSNLEDVFPLLTPTITDGIPQMSIPNLTNPFGIAQADSLLKNLFFAVSAMDQATRDACCRDGRWEEYDSLIDLRMLFNFNYADQAAVSHGEHFAPRTINPLLSTPLSNPSIWPVGLSPLVPDVPPSLIFP